MHHAEVTFFFLKLNLMVMSRWGNVHIDVDACISPTKKGNFSAASFLSFFLVRVQPQHIFQITHCVLTPPFLLTIYFKSCTKYFDFPYQNMYNYNGLSRNRNSCLANNLNGDIFIDPTKFLLYLRYCLTLQFWVVRVLQFTNLIEYTHGLLFMVKY